MTHDERATIIAQIWVLSGVVGREDISWESLAEWTDAEVKNAGDVIQANPMLRELLDLAEKKPEGTA